MSTCSNCGFEGAAGFNFCPSCGTQALPVQAVESSLVGRTFNNKYRLLAEIGSGNMGTVYRAEHVRLGKNVALKLLHPGMQLSKEALQRLHREGIAAGKFSHPNAIQIFDFEQTEEGFFYLAMELVEGQTLGRFLREHGPQSVDIAQQLVAQILSVLAQAHPQGIVHRDLKPENIMVVREASGSWSIKVLDFGLSKLIHTPLEKSLQTIPGRIMGTPLYMSPEQCNGQTVDHRSDLYSVGLILYELIVGSPPFQGDSLGEILYKHTHQPVPPLLERDPELEVPADLEDLIQKSLAKNPEDSFDGATDMLQALRSIDLQRLAQQSGQRTAILDYGGAEPAFQKADPSRRSFRLRTVLALVVVLVLIASWIRFERGQTTAAEVIRISLKAAQERTAEESSYVEHLQATRRHLKNNDLDRALVEIDQAHDLSCRDSEAYLLRARVFRLKRDYPTAWVDLQDALRLDSTYAEASLEQGWVLLDQARFPEALARFEQVAQDQPELAAAHCGQGAALFHLQRIPESRTALDQALHLDAEVLYAQRYRGLALLADGELEAAAQCLTEAKRRNSSDAQAWSGLGQIYERQGQLAQAEAQYRDALKRQVEAVDVRVRLAALLIERQDLSEAARILNQGLHRHPSHFDSLLLLATIDHAQGDPDQAIEHLQKAVAENPLHVEARLFLGQLLHQQELYAEALQQFEDALLLDPGQPLAALNAGLCLIRLEEYEAARDSLEEATSLSPQNLLAHHTLGLLYKDYLGNRPAAEESFRAYLSLGGDDPRVSAWLGQTSQ